MPRPGLSSEEIIAAAQDLIASGEKVTIQGVREKLGSRGSITTISKVLKQWKEGGPITEPEEMQTSPQQSLPITQPMPAVHTDSRPTAPAPVSSGEIVKSNPVASEPTALAPPQQPSGQRFDRRERLGFKKRPDRPDHTPHKRDTEEHRHHGQQHQQAHHQHQAQPHQNHNNAPLQAPHHHNEHSGMNSGHARPSQGECATPRYMPEVYQSENLDNLNDKELIVKIRRLEIYLNKEQSRREAAEKMARDAKEYAETIKEQIGQRITDLRLAMEETVNQLKNEAREMKNNAEADLRFYREQLDKANKKIIGLLSGDEPKS